MTSSTSVENLVDGFCYVCDRKMQLRHFYNAPRCVQCDSDAVELADQSATNESSQLNRSRTIELLSSNDSDSVIASVADSSSQQENSAAETASAKSSTSGLFGMLDDIVDALVVSPLNALSGAVGLGSAAPHEFKPPPASAQYVASLHVDVISSAEQLALIQSKQSESVQCAICMSGFQIGDRLVHLLCRHAFHDECVLPWLKQSSTCPSCRFQLPTDDRKFERRKKH